MFITYFFWNVGNLIIFFQIFSGIFPINYEPPPGDFYFEVDDKSPVIQVNEWELQLLHYIHRQSQTSSLSSMQDDPLLFDYNVKQRVNDFVAAALVQVRQGLICSYCYVMHIFDSYILICWSTLHEDWCYLLPTTNLLLN